MTDRVLIQLAAYALSTSDESQAVPAVRLRAALAEVRP
jgi:hypothetical protein